MDEELSRHGLLLERLDIKLDLTIELLGMIDEKIEDLRDELDLRFEEVEYKVSVILSELDDIHHKKS